MEIKLETVHCEQGYTHKWLPDLRPVAPDSKADCFTCANCETELEISLSVEEDEGVFLCTIKVHTLKTVETFQEIQ